MIFATTSHGARSDWSRRRPTCSQLSGGERQRLAIARALIRKPPLLIFDEATSALDSLTEEQVSNTVRSISAQRTQMTMLIAHRLSTIMHADTIVVLEKGALWSRARMPTCWSGAACTTRCGGSRLANGYRSRTITRV